MTVSEHSVGDGKREHVFFWSSLASLSGLSALQVAPSTALPSVQVEIEDDEGKSAIPFFDIFLSVAKLGLESAVGDGFA